MRFIPRQFLILITACSLQESYFLTICKKNDSSVIFFIALYIKERHGPFQRALGRNLKRMNNSSKKEDLPKEEDIRFILSSVKDWSDQMLRPALDKSLPDGDRTMWREAIDELYELGLIFYPDPASEGYEMGIWGAFTEVLGTKYSLWILTEIAQTCATASSLVHWQGIAASCILQAENLGGRELKRIAFAFQDAEGMPPAGSLLHSEMRAWKGFETRALPCDNGYELSGRKTFVYMQEECRALIVPARLNEEWAVFLVPLKAVGLHLVDPGQRTGLRYLKLRHVHFEKVGLSRDALIAAGKAAEEMILRTWTLNWLGIAAIARGVALGSLQIAGQYAAERYQGGTEIKNHDAIWNLLSDARSSLEMAGDLIEKTAEMDFGIPQLRASARLKLKLVDECSRVVSDMMQVLGGYGYMEDFGIEKRLRDIQVLKLGNGSPLYLKRFIYESGK